jgi:hypothetical protein
MPHHCRHDGDPTFGEAPQGEVGRERAYKKRAKMQAKAALFRHLQFSRSFDSRVQGM